MKGLWWIFYQSLTSCSNMKPREPRDRLDQHVDIQKISVLDFWSSFFGVSSEALRRVLRSTYTKLHKSTDRMINWKFSTGIYNPNTMLPIARGSLPNYSMDAQQSLKSKLVPNSHLYFRDGYSWYPLHVEGSVRDLCKIDEILENSLRGRFPWRLLRSVLDWVKTLRRPSRSWR